MLRQRIFKRTIIKIHSLFSFIIVQNCYPGNKTRVFIIRWSHLLLIPRLQDIKQQNELSWTTANSTSFSYKSDNDKAPETLRHHLDKQAQGTKASLGNLKTRSTYEDPLLTKELQESPMTPKAKGGWMNCSCYVTVSTIDLCLTQHVVHNTKGLLLSVLKSTCSTPQNLFRSHICC